MKFLDINTFYSPKAGGIRTYHQAKLNWFRRSSSGQEYHFIYPGAENSKIEEAGVLDPISPKRPTIFQHIISSPALTADPSGYRLLLNFWKVFQIIRKVKPDCIEVGDPWLTGLFILALKKSGIYSGLVTAFYHSDPVPSYLLPWAEKGRGRFLKVQVVRLFAVIFYRLQNQYDFTLVSSSIMQVTLRKQNIHSLAYLPFGVPDEFLVPLKEKVRDFSSSPIRLLYAGRLDKEKGIELLLHSLPQLFQKSDIELSVMGRGAFSESFSKFSHPRYKFYGFIESIGKVRDIYDGHDILLAPGPFETFGLGVLEAMARGLIVVGPDAGGTGELLRQAPCPYIFRDKNGEDFVPTVIAAVQEVLENRKSKNLNEDFSTRKNSRALAEKYGTWSDAIERMVQFYLRATSPELVSDNIPWA